MKLGVNGLISGFPSPFHDHCQYQQSQIFSATLSLPDNDQDEGTTANTTNGDGSSGDAYAMELIIGVASTLASAAMISLS